MCVYIYIYIYIYIHSQQPLPSSSHRAISPYGHRCFCLPFSEPTYHWGLASHTVS